MHKNEGGPGESILMPVTAGEKANPWLDLEQTCLVRISAEAPRPHPTGEGLSMTAGEQRMLSKRVRRDHVCCLK